MPYTKQKFVTEENKLIYPLLTASEAGDVSRVRRILAEDMAIGVAAADACNVQDGLVRRTHRAPLLNVYK
eukprot:2524263-Pyramimonas_sp.AAC.1